MMQLPDAADVESYAEFYRSSTGMLIKRLQPPIGAEISEVDLAGTISTDVAQDIRDALLAHGVIFFRNQKLDYEKQVALASFFGDVITDGPDPQRPEVFPIKSKGGSKDESANKWHSDGCYQKSPPAISFLRSIRVPKLGGDTCFASAVAAYDGLADEMKDRIATLRYSTSVAHATRRAIFNTREKYAELAIKYPPCDHPVVRIHPETGAKTLYVNETYAITIVGMEGQEGIDLIRDLSDEFRRPEYQVRWKWTPDALAIWDNRAVQHYAVPNQSTDRYLERVTVLGTPTLSIADWEALNKHATKEPAHA